MNGAVAAFDFYSNRIIAYVIFFVGPWVRFIVCNCVDHFYEAVRCAVGVKPEFIAFVVELSDCIFKNAIKSGICQIGTSSPGKQFWKRHNRCIEIFSGNPL